MTAVRKASEHDIEILLASLTPQIRRAFLQAISALKNPEELERILELLKSGRINEAMAIVESHITRFASSTIPFYSLAGEVAATALSNLLGVVISFDQTNFRAVRMMQEARLRLIREFTAEQRNSVQQMLVQGVRDGTNPLSTARELRNVIGLTARQQMAVENYRRLLIQGSADALSRELRDRRFDSTVRRAVRGDSVLTRGQVDTMVDRYASRLLDYRAQTIARTESLRAANMGSQLLYLQAIESGDVNPDELEQEWITAEDERVRGSHAGMHGQKRPFGEAFESGDGNALQFPGDPNAPAKEVINCRCALTTRLTSSNKET